MEAQKLLSRLSVSVILVISGLTCASWALDLDALTPKTKDLERVQKFEKLADPKIISGVRKFEKLRDAADLDKVNSVAHGGAGASGINRAMSVGGGRVQKYIFYLFSQSVPDVTVNSVFDQAKKLVKEDIVFYGVVRGVDGDRKILDKFRNLRSKGIRLKINPLIFRGVGAEVVPAFVYAVCPEKNSFRSRDCDYRLVVYGDMTLAGALEKLSQGDVALEGVYKRLRDNL